MVAAAAAAGVEATTSSATAADVEKARADSPRSAREEEAMVVLDVR